jgi:hypothetical protein
MAKQKHERKAYRPQPPFGIVEGVGTPPFKRLSPFAVWVLVKFYEKFNGYNRSDLSLSYSEVRPVMSTPIFNRAIWQLLSFGFVDVRKWGRLEKKATLFGLSDRWRRFNKSDSEKELDKIAGQLQEIEILKRQKWPEGRKSEKRERMTALRSSLFKVKCSLTMATSN